MAVSLLAELKRRRVFRALLGYAMGKNLSVRKMLLKKLNPG